MEALARQLINTLNQLAIPYVVLHGAERLDGGFTGDLDLAVEQDQYVVLRSLLDPLQDRCSPVMLWPSSRVDLGSVWLSDNWSESVQLDLSCDPVGRGRYGLLTHRAVSSRIWNGNCWVLPNELERAYLISKRWAKGDSLAVRALSSGLLPEQLPEVCDYFSRKAVSRMQRASLGLSPLGVTDRWYLRERFSFRSIRRLLEPEGIWHQAGAIPEDQIADFSTRFPTLLPYIRFYKREIPWIPKLITPTIAPLITLEYWSPSQSASSQLIEEWAKVATLLSARARDRIRKRSLASDRH